MKKDKLLIYPRSPIVKQIRGTAVVLDADLAALFEVETKRLNEALRRNPKRFPQEFAFQLTEEEWESLRSQIATSKIGRGGRRYLPWVFTEHGVTMMASVLNSEKAIEINLMVVNEFIRMRTEASAYAELARKIDNLEMATAEELSELWATLRALEGKRSSTQQIGFRQTRERRSRYGGEKP